jgi:hypothetical protein
MILKKTSTLCLIIILFFASCNKPFDEIDTSTNALNPEFAVPLLNTTMEMGDFISGLQGNGALVVNNDGSYNLTYEGAILANPTLKLFETMPETPTIPITDNNMSVVFPTPNGLKISNMSFKQGFIKWKMASVIDVATVTLTMPQLVNEQGISFVKTFNISKNGSVDSVILRGLFVKPLNGKMQFNIVVKDALGNKTNLKEGSFSMSKYEPQMVQGILIAREVVIPKSTIQFDFFKKWKLQGNVQFQNPKVTTTFNNSYGLPTRVFMDIFEVETTEGKTVALKSPLTKLSNGANIALKPTILGLNEIGKTKKTIYEFNATNSNLNELFNAHPMAFNFSSRAVVGDSTAQGFFSDTSNLSMKMDISVPISGTSKGFLTENTEGVDFSSYEKVTDVELKVITNNTLPFDINLQCYFLDNKDEIIDSLAQKPTLILRGAIVNSNGSIARPSDETTFVKIEAERFKRLLLAKKMRLQYLVSTSSNGTIPVKILSNQGVALRIGLKGKVKY